MMRWRCIAVLLVLVLGHGCADEGSYKLHIVFEDPAAAESIGEVVIWALNPAEATCTQLFSGDIDPNEPGQIEPYSRLAVAYPTTDRANLGKVPAGHVVFFAEGRDVGGARLLRGCTLSDVKAGADVEVTVVLRRFCEVDADCDDDNGCTSDLCVSAECHHSPFPDGLQCNDKSACTSGDHCVSGECQGQHKDCSAFDAPCVQGSCDPQTGECGAAPMPDRAECNDGLFCTDPDSCIRGACTGSILDCDDGNECTDDSCNEGEDRCDNILVSKPGAEGPRGDATCSNGLDDDCDELTDTDDPNCGQCTLDSECNDGNPCTDDTCTLESCENTPVADGTGCDDGQYCSENDSCTGGVCGGDPLDCSAWGGSCSTGVCREEQDRCEMQPLPDDTGCDDGQFCTVGDSCQQGVCQGVQRDCDDSDFCTLDTCDEDSDECNHTPQTIPGAEEPPGDPVCQNQVDDDCDGRTDEDDPSCLNVIFRSVGVNTSDLNTDGRTVEISGTTATFSGPMPDNFGVGDVLQYRSGGTVYIAFVHTRESDTIYEVRSADGGDPRLCSSGTQVNVYRAYASLSKWDDQLENPSIDSSVRDFDTSHDLVSIGKSMFIACYADGEDTTGVRIDGWNTDSHNYIKIFTPNLPSEVGISQRHDGKWNPGAYRLVDSKQWGGILGIASNYVRIEGLQIEPTYPAGGNDDVIGIELDGADGEIHISHNIIRYMQGGSLNEFDTGIEMREIGFGANVKIWNNIIYNFYRGISRPWTGISTIYGVIYNNTIVDSSSTGIYIRHGYFKNYLYVRNNLVQGSGDSDYTLTHVSGTSDNISQDGSSPSSSHDDTTITFADAANDDFHLASSDTAAMDEGTDLSDDSRQAFSDDIDGQSRPAANWDIGADER